MKARNIFKRNSSKTIWNFLIKQFQYLATKQITYIAFGIYLATTLTVYTVIPEIFPSINILLKLLKYFCYVVFLCKSYTDIKHDQKISWTIIIFAILSVLSFLFSHNRILPILCCILVGLRKMNITKTIKIAYYVSIVIFLLTISLALLGIIPNWIFFTRGPIARNALGFIYATDCISIYLSIILMYFYLKRSSAKIFEITLLEILNLFLYKATGGRLSFILITALLAILSIGKLLRLVQTNNHNKYAAIAKHTFQRFQQKVSHNHSTLNVIKAICCILPITLFVIYNSLVIAYMKNPQGMEKIDQILSSRLSCTAQTYEKYHIPLFGKDITWQGLGGYGYIDEIDIDHFEYNFIDSSYARLIFDFGIIYTLAILIAYMHSTALLFQKEKLYSRSHYYFHPSMVFYRALFNRYN